MNKRLQQYYLNVMGMPQWRLKAGNFESSRSMESEPSLSEPDQITYAPAVASGWADIVGAAQPDLDVDHQQIQELPSASLNPTDVLNLDSEPSQSNVNNQAAHSHSQLSGSSSHRETAQNTEDPRTELSQSHESLRIKSSDLETVSEKVLEDSQTPRLDQLSIDTKARSEEQASGERLTKERLTKEHLPSEHLYNEQEPGQHTTGDSQQNPVVVQVSSSPVSNEGMTTPPGEPITTPGVQPDGLQSLAAQINTCRQCQQRANAENAICGQYFLNAGAPKNQSEDNQSLVVLSLAPTQSEYEQGRYLNPPYDGLFHNILKAVKLDSHPIFYSALLKCAARDNHCAREEEIQSCRNFLLQELSMINPHLVVCLGNAAQYLIDPQQSITKQTEDEHGPQWDLNQLRDACDTFTLNDAKIPIVTTFHPAFLYRNPLFKSKALDDWIKIAAHLV